MQGAQHAVVEQYRQPKNTEISNSDVQRSTLYLRAATAACQTHRHGAPRLRGHPAAAAAQSRSGRATLRCTDLELCCPNTRKCLEACRPASSNQCIEAASKQHPRCRQRAQGPQLQTAIALTGSKAIDHYTCVLVYQQQLQRARWAHMQGCRRAHAEQQLVRRRKLPCLKLVV